MRPRLNYLAFRPPVRLADLEGRLTPSGYVLVSEKDSDQIAAAIPLKYLPDIPTDHLEHYAEKVLYVPWSASVATALGEMRRLDRHVAAVISEHGDTIGIATIDDILETVLHRQKSRSERILKTAGIADVSPDTWVVTGMTTLRRLSRHLGVEFPRSKCVTVAGVLQEQLQRMPLPGDTVNWSGLAMTVMQVPERGQLTVRVERRRKRGHSE